jgi:hypothetical protein
VTIVTKSPKSLTTPHTSTTEQLNCPVAVTVLLLCESLKLNLHMHARHAVGTVALCFISPLRLPLGHFFYFTGLSSKEVFVEKRKRGQYPGPAFLGCKNIIISPGVRNIALEPPIADKVKDLFDTASTGLATLDAVWKHAAAINLPSKAGNVLAKSTIEDLLQRRAYNGVFKYGGGEWHQATYEPLISEELFEKVQRAMGWVKNIDNSQRVTPFATSGRDYDFKGLFLYQTCKFNVTAYIKIKKLASGITGEYPFYTYTK